MNENDERGTARDDQVDASDAASPRHGRSGADTRPTADRLATYGTLAPGRPNHHHLATLAGTWSKGIVRGSLVQAGWGAALGFPGLVLDPGADPVEVDLFVSPDLPSQWSRLDAFEGSGYRRVMARIETATGHQDAWIYVLAERHPKTGLLADNDPR